MIIIKSSVLKKIFNENKKILKYQDLDLQLFLKAIVEKGLLYDPKYKPRLYRDQPPSQHENWELKESDGSKIEFDMFSLFTVVSFLHEYIEDLDFLNAEADIKIIRKDFRLFKKVIEKDFDVFDEYFTKHFGDYSKMDKENIEKELLKD